MSERVGLSREQVQGLKRAAEQAGLVVQDQIRALTEALRTFQQAHNRPLSDEQARDGQPPAPDGSSSDGEVRR